MYLAIPDRRRMNGCLGCVSTSTLGRARRLGLPIFDDSGNMIVDSSGGATSGSSISSGSSSGGNSTASGFVNVINAIGKALGGGKSNQKPTATGGNFLDTIPSATLAVGGIAALALIVGLTR